MKRVLFRFHYPKLALLAVMIIFAYVIFSNNFVQQYFSQIGQLSYLGIFLAGLLFSFGFTTPYAIGLFLVINPVSLPLAALIGGFGAFLSDYLIFKTIKMSFMDEFHELEKTWPIAATERTLKKRLPTKAKTFLLYVTAGFIFASPLPDELGVTLLAGLSTIKIEKFAILSLISNTIGIAILLLI